MIHFAAIFKRLVVCLPLITILPAWVYADQATSIDELAEQIRQTDEQLSALKQKIDNNNLLKRDLQAAFEAAQDKRGERDQRLAELDSRINEFNARLDELDASIIAAGQTIEQRKQLLALALRHSQSVGDSTGLRDLLQHDNPAQAQRLQLYREYLFRAQHNTVRSAITFLEGVEKAHLNALKDRNWLSHIRRKADEQRQSYDRKAQTARQQLDTVESELEQTTRSVAQLQQDQQRLQSLMEELEALQRNGSGYFATLQGKYELPVAGNITANFGDRKSVGKLRWQGLFISAREGQPVRAIADGEVVYSDWLQGFGMLVIIDHGDGYMTLYGGNRSVTATKGSWAQSGSTIATVGNSGGQSTSGLYFEIRHNATAMDPENWLKPPSS